MEELTWDKRAGKCLTLPGQGIFSRGALCKGRSPRAPAVPSSSLRLQPSLAMVIDRACGTWPQEGQTEQGEGLCF